MARRRRGVLLGSGGGLALAGALLAADGPRTSWAEEALAGLHCCSAPESETLLLACEAGPGDAIVSVPFAAYGDVSGGSGSSCGREVAPACGASVQQAVEARCVGSQQCLLSAGDFGDPCPEVPKELRVRWVCRSDSADRDPRAQAQPAPPAELPALPLRAEGSVVVDAAGQRVRLSGVAWSGIHIKGVPGGLDVAPLPSIARLIGRLGFNVVRLTFSAEAVLQNSVVEDRRVAANPQLVGRRTLDVLDEVVGALRQEGVLVWLDNHMLDSDWCCNTWDCNGLWFNERYPAQAWVDMWRLVARRYGSNQAVIGVGLKNEPRSICTGGNGFLSCNVSGLARLAGGDEAPDPYGMKKEGRECVWPQWSSGPEMLQWRPAVERAGRAILAEAPHLLIGVSGLHYAQFLQDVARSPVDLPRQNLVYEAHEYSWFRDHSSGGRFHHERDAGGAFANYSQQVDQNWGYLLREGLAPVFVTEFGMGHEWTNNDAARQWFQLWSRYVQDEGPLGGRGGLDFTYWQLPGVHIGGTSKPEGSEASFGILNRCWTGPWKESHYAAVQSLGLRSRRQLAGEEEAGETVSMSGARGLAPRLLASSLWLAAAWKS